MASALSTLSNSLNLILLISRSCKATTDLTIEDRYMAKCISLTYNKALDIN